MTILLVGGTGRVGSAVLDELLGRDEPVRCLSHTPEKLAATPPGVERIGADLDDPSTLGAAFDGVRAMLLSLPVSPAEEARGKAALSAAVRAGVPKVVHISVKHYPGSETRVFYKAKQLLEAEISRCPFSWTILHAANFFQADSTLKSYIFDQGLYTPPIGRVGVDKMDARDVGHAAAKALTSDDFDRRHVDLYGPATFTGDSSAAVFAEAVGRPVSYMGDDIGRWADLNRSRLGPWYIDALSGLYEQQQNFGMRRPATEPQHPLLPANLRTFEAYAAELASVWTGSSR